jgi:AcrR family transcriptional regulator
VRPYAKGVERRAQILATALEVFATRGERGASLREIADRVGLTQTGLLHYFGSREELLLAVLRERDRQAEDLTAGVADPLEAVARTVARNETVPGLVLLYVSVSAASADPGHPAKEYFTGRYRKYREALREGIEEMQRAGTARTDVPAADMAALVLAAADGIQVQWLLDPEVDMVRAIRTIVTMICAGPGAAGG